MAWTTPATYSVGQILRASDMNLVSANITWLGGNHAHDATSGAGGNITWTNLHGNNWTMIATNGSGVATEIAVGAANTVLNGNGASAAPSFGALPIAAISTSGAGSGNAIIYNGSSVGWGTPSASGFGKVSAGSGTATNLNLTGLSGYRRYTLILRVGDTGSVWTSGQTWTLQLNGDTGSNYVNSYTKVIGSTRTDAAQSGTTSALVAAMMASTAAGQGLLILNIVTPAASSKLITFFGNFASGATASGGSSSYQTSGGGLTSTASSITAIKVTWTDSISYDYILLGNNDVS